MIKAIEENLQRGINLLNSISDAEYSDASVAPYFSSIGCHTRHILDVFKCVLIGLESKEIDLTIRERNEMMELKTSLGIEYFQSTINQLKEASLKYNSSEKFQVTDDLGLGRETATYTFGSILMHAQSHAIHHFSTIGYIIYHLGMELPDEGFGFNPTTVKRQS